MTLLALDTALGLCTAVVARAGGLLAHRSEPMARGHQERLAPLVAEVMAEAGVGFGDLDRIGVTLGPGSFTGVRVGLAYAKGLALALQRPLIGLSTLDALAQGRAGPGAAVIDARRGQVYIGLHPGGAPRALGLDEARTELVALSAAYVVGPGAELFADLDGLQVIEQAGPTPQALAAMVAEAPLPDGPLRPLYLRAPDAKLPGGVDP